MQIPWHPPCDLFANTNVRTDRLACLLLKYIRMQLLGNMKLYPRRQMAHVHQEMPSVRTPSYSLDLVSISVTDTAVAASSSIRAQASVNT